jgi:tetratricopeptide (TPR) repeat protein
MYRPFSIIFLSIALSLMSATLRAGPADELIAKGDACALKFEATEALKFYLPAEKLEPDNEHLLARISREYRHEMSNAMQPEQKLNLGSTAVEYAKRAATLAPNDPEAQLAVAISYGKLELLEGNREKFEASRIIKNAADKVIELDPTNDLAWHVLGRWHMALADVNAFERAPRDIGLRQTARVDLSRGSPLLRESNRPQSQSTHALHRTGTCLHSYGTN